jgi:hypothetical protein
VIRVMLTILRALVWAWLAAGAVTPDAPLCAVMLTHLEAGAAAMILASDCAAAVRPLATGHSSSCTSADTPPEGHGNTWFRCKCIKADRCPKAPKALAVDVYKPSC